MVQRETIERICADVTQLPERTIEAEFDRFFVAQGPVCDFLIETLAETSQRGRELALFLSYVAFKALSIDSGLSGSIDSDKIRLAGEQTRNWLERIDEFEWRPQPAGTTSAYGVAPLGEEPFLASFVAAEIDDTDGADSALPAAEKGLILFAVQTVILSMAAGTGRPSAQDDTR